MQCGRADRCALCRDHRGLADQAPAEHATPLAGETSPCGRPAPPRARRGRPDQSAAGLDRQPTTEPAPGPELSDVAPRTWRVPILATANAILSAHQPLAPTQQPEQDGEPKDEPPPPRTEAAAPSGPSHRRLVAPRSERSGTGQARHHSFLPPDQRVPRPTECGSPASVGHRNAGHVGDPHRTNALHVPTCSGGRPAVGVTGQASERSQRRVARRLVSRISRSCAVAGVTAVRTWNSADAWR